MATSIPRVNLPPIHGPTRDAAILARIDAGNFDPLRWSVVTIGDNGHRVDVRMLQFPLSMDGVIVNVSAHLQQQIADKLLCVLCTGKLIDLHWLARGVSLAPSPQPIASSTQAMEEHSARVFGLLADAGGFDAAQGKPVATYGKNWILRNETVRAHPDMACNYGWNFPGQSFGGIANHAVTPGLYVIQDPGWFHDPTHDDYSQVCMLASRVTVADGKLADLATDVYGSPVLAPLVSDEGALLEVRVRGVPQSAPSSSALLQNATMPTWPGGAPT